VLGVLVLLSISVRLARADEAEAVASAYRASREEAFSGLIPSAAVLPRTYADDVRRWREFADSDDGLLFVAESQGDILGLAALEHSGPLAELGALYVQPSSYRNGAGSALLSMTLSAAADSYAEVIAWVLASNQRAKDFFLSRGGWLDGGTEIRSINDSAKLVMQRIRFQVGTQGPGGRQ
jgi:hypothetical protein